MKKQLTIEQHRRVAPLVLGIQEGIALLAAELEHPDTHEWLVTEPIQGNYLRMGDAANALHELLARDEPECEKIYRVPDESPAAHHSYLPVRSRPHGPPLREWPLNPYDMRLPWVHAEQLKRTLPTEPDGPRMIVGVIEPHSPPGLRQAAARLAIWFKREFHFDFPPYDARSHEPDCRIFVWADGNRLVTGKVPLIGAAGFGIEDRLPSRPWILGWVWFHPYARRQGHLTRAWPYFRERFGDFLVETPLSEAMEAFLMKVDPEAIGRLDRAARGPV